jgi:hypothetical protein
MKKLPDKIFRQVEIVAKKVLNDLKSKGHVIPTSESNGSIRFENFIVKKNNDLYTITGKNDQVIADNINLPHTAAVLANGLALGKIVDSDLIKLDREYGYRQFDEDLFLAAQKRKKNSLDQILFYQTKYEINKLKKDAVKNRILESFRKLTTIR